MTVRRPRPRAPAPSGALPPPPAWLPSTLLVAAIVSVPLALLPFGLLLAVVVVILAAVTLVTTGGGGRALVWTALGFGAAVVGVTVVLNAMATSAIWFLRG